MIDVKLLLRNRNGRTLSKTYQDAPVVAEETYTDEEIEELIGRTVKTETDKVKDTYRYTFDAVPTSTTLAEASILEMIRATGNTYREFCFDYNLNQGESTDTWRILLLRHITNGTITVLRFSPAGIHKGTAARTATAFTWTDVFAF